MLFDLLFPEEHSSSPIKGLDLLVKERVPKHVGIIMDGNRRWAKRKGVPVAEGHWNGAETILKAALNAKEFGIKVLSLYSFSTENWLRSEEEVRDLLHLIATYVEEKTEFFIKHSIRVDSVGDLSPFPLFLREKMAKCKEDTAQGSALTLVFALNYGGRDEIRRAMTKMAENVELGLIESKDISEGMIESYLDTASIGNPELIIRTSGEQRLSNFFPWQSAYSELYFTQTLWPDFGSQEMLDALIEYQRRQRRFGE